MRKKIFSFFVIFILILALLIGAFAFGRKLYPMSYREFVDRYAQEYGVPRSLVYSVIHTESRFDPSATSQAQAIGLMQITKDTLDWLAWKNNETIDTAEQALLDPETNIRYGCLFLSLLLEEFPDEQTALAAYNAGRGRVLSWLADELYSRDGKHLSAIPYPETEKYVQNVLQTQTIYKILFYREDLS